MKTITRYVLPAGLAAGLALALFFQVRGEPSFAMFAGVAAGAFGCAWAVARSTRLGVLLTALGSLGSSLYLFWHKLSASGEPSLCTVNTVINCDTVNTSVYSDLFGLPVALMGAAFYTGLALAALTPPKSTPRFHQVNALFGMLAVAMSAYLAAASVSIGAVCVMCISLYVGNLLLLIAGLKGLRETGGTPFADLAGAISSRSFLTVSVVFVVVLLVGRTAIDGGSSARTAPGQPVPESRIGSLYAQPAGPVVLDGSEPVLGDPHAPYQIVEFADFACPHCATAFADFKQVVAQNPDIQVRFKAYPLSGACNPMLEGEAGSERCIAALAAECAHRQGRFWEMAGAMFKNIGYLAPSDLEFMAGQSGLDVPAWKACLEDTAAQAGVLADIDAGIKARIRGTPTLFLKGIDDDRFVLVNYGPADALAIVEAHRAGRSLPPPGPAPSR